MLLASHEGSTTALVTFAGVNDAAALQTISREEAGTGAVLLDLEGASESLVAKQRTRLLWSLGIAAVLLIAVVCVRSAPIVQRVLRVLAPMALTTLILVAVTARCRRRDDTVSPDRADTRRRPRPRLRTVLRARCGRSRMNNAALCMRCWSVRCRR